MLDRLAQQMASRTEKVITVSNLAPDILTPEQSDADDFARIYSFLSAHENAHGSRPEPRYYLSGADEHDRVELTGQLFEILKQAVEALTNGRSVSILTRGQEISTQQAAEILGLSRPTVVRLIEDGVINATVPGAIRRKLRLEDVLRYRTSLYQRRNDFIAETSSGFDDDVDAGDLLDEARRAH